MLFCLQLWKCIMDSVEWNKKEELVAEQALKHLKVILKVLCRILVYFTLIVLYSTCMCVNCYLIYLKHYIIITYLDESSFMCGHIVYSDLLIFCLQK